MLAIKLLGEPELTRHDEPVGRFRSRKALALFIYLVASPGAHPRETLVDLLWDAPSSEQGYSNLRNALSYLRRELDDYLFVDQTSLAFDAHSRHELDLTEFTSALAPVSADGDLTPIGAAYLERALDWYRGPFLSGFSIANAPRFDEWLLLERERYHAQAMTACRRLVEHYLAEAEWTAGIAAARRWLALDPLDEAGHVALMQLLALDSQRPAALAQFDALSDMLDREFGVAPGPEAAALVARIRAGALTPPDRKMPEPLPAVRETTTLPIQAPAHNLGRGATGHYATEFVGREAELARLEDLLAGRKTRLVTITGAGGMGKTRLATALAARQLAATQAPGRLDPRFPQGIYLVPLAPLSGAGQIVGAIAETVGLSLSDAENAPPPDRQLLDFLRRRQMLLVLDNMEHLLDEREMINGLLTRLNDVAPKLHLVVTSREPLDTPGETVVAIEGLTLPGTEAAGLDALHYPAVRLFLGSARRVRPDYTVDENDLQAIDRVCRSLAGIPLAIELAAAWVDALSPADLLAEISRDATILHSLSGNAPERQRSMRAVFDHSWRRLAPAEQDLFGRLSVFRDGFTTDAAAVVGDGATRLALAGLTKKSLLAYRPDRGRYEMHELLRQFATEKLHDQPDLEAELRGRLAGYYSRWLAAQEPGLRGGRQAEALRAIGTDLENIRRAWRWAAEQRDAGCLDLALAPLHPHFYSTRGFQMAGAEECRLAADRLRGATEPEDRRVLARLLGESAEYAYFFGRMADAARLRDECRAVLEELTDSDLDLRAEWAYLHRLQGKALRMSDLAQARAEYERSIALYREIGDTWNVTMTLSWLADVVGRSGDDAARRWITEEALALQESAGDRRGATFSLLYLAGHAISDGRLTEARQLARRARDHARELGEHSAANIAIQQQGVIALLGGDFVEAETRLSEALAGAQAAGHSVLVKDSLLFLGRTALAQQQFAAAQAHFRRARLFAEERGMQPTRIDADGYRGQSLLYTGELEEAVRALEAAVSRAREMGYGRGVQRWGAALVLARLHAGQPDRARSLLAELTDPRDRVVPALAMRVLDQSATDLDALIAPLRSQSFLRRQDDLSEALALGGIILALTEDEVASRAYLGQAVEAALRNKAFAPLLYALAGAARLWPAEPEWRSALAKQPLPAASHWFASVTGPLPPSPSSHHGELPALLTVGERLLAKLRS